MVYRGGLENRFGLITQRGFESLPLRQTGIANDDNMAEQQKGNATAAKGSNANASAPVRPPVAVANATQPVPPISKLDANATIVVPPGRSVANKTEPNPQQGGGLLGTILWLVVLTVVFVLAWRAGWIHRLRVFAEETQEQLRKCTWPTRHELAQHVVVVLLGTLILAVFTMASEFVAREVVWGALLDTKTLLFSKN